MVIDQDCLLVKRRNDNHSPGLDVNKMTDLIQEYNLTEQISKHTHFTEHSSSMIDLILVRSNAHILNSGVIDTFIPDQVH